jgi:tetratricopeptide (TPR) repeat protein
MAETPESPARGAPGVSALDESRRLFREAERFEAAHEAGRQLESLKRFLAHVEEHRRDLDNGSTEIAQDLDVTAMAFYRQSQGELALRAVEVGLSLSPGSSALLHHKALVLLSLNRQIDQAVLLLDRSIEANPHDKRAWATKGDALKVLGRNGEAAEAYLSAQRLDAASTQYVDRALKLDPKNPVALRMKLQLARSGGGEQQALEAANALLATNPGDPDLLLEKARLLATLGQFQPALETLQPVATERPEDPHVRFLKARLLFAMGRLEEALPLYRGLVESKELTDPVVIAEIASDLEKNGQEPDLLIATRQRWRELEPPNVGNLQALRTIAVARNRNDLAVEASRAILEASPHNLEAQRALLDLLLTAGKFDDVLPVGREILADHPTEVSELKRVLHAAQVAAQPEAVREFAAAILQAQPGDEETEAALAAAVAQAGEKEKALGLYERLSEKQPSETRYLLERRQLLVDLNRAPDLVPVLDAIFRLDPSRYDIALERGNLYLGAAYELSDGSADREDAAREAMLSYERASLDAAHRAEAQLGAARASRLVHDLPKAVKAYREFLTDPDSATRGDVLKELGHVLREMDRPNEAREAYEKAVVLGGEDDDLFWGLVETLSRLNQETQALRFLDLLLQREPGSPAYLRRKGQLLMKAGRRADGLVVLKNAIQASQGDPHAYFEIAEALRAQGAYGDAVTYFVDGLKVDPKSRAGRLGLAETYRVAGRFTDALPLVDQLLHEEPNDLRAWKIRVEVQRALGHYSEVVYSLKAILLLDPRNLDALAEKYQLQLKQNQRAEAFDTLTDLLAVGGASVEVAALWLEHGDLAAELGKSDVSNKSYETALRLEPARKVEIAARRAKVRLQAGRADLALEALDSVPVPDPQRDPARAVPFLLLRAQVLTTLERPADARASYEAVRTVDPQNPEAVQGLARSLLDEGKPEEARSFIRSVLPLQPARADLFLLFSEAEAALGSLPFAAEVIRRGLETLPKSIPLWVQLGELHVRQESWEKAADAYAHSIALDRSNPELLLRAGFVAEKLNHGHEALTLYTRAAELAPGNKYAWSSQGVALLMVGRPTEAQASFDRALALDSDFEAAKEGRKTAVQRTRDSTIEKYGRQALLLEARLNRSVTKNDLFVTLHIPFDYLDPVLQILSRSPRVEVDRLSPEEMQDLEIASYHLIHSALESRPAGVERRGLTLADVAALAPETYTLGQIQRLFGYLQGVLEMDLKPQTLRLTPDVEELARKALLLPEEQRTLFQLVEGLRVGVFKARVIKAVEAAGHTAHAPLPTLDLGAYSPELRPVAAAAGTPHLLRGTSPAMASTDGEALFPELVGLKGAGARGHRPPPPAEGLTRCLGCGGIASVLHECGAPLCHQCISQFHSCPKCTKPVTASNSTALESAPSLRPAARERPATSLAPSSPSVPHRHHEEPSVGERAPSHPPHPGQGEHEVIPLHHAPHTAPSHESPQRSENSAPHTGPTHSIHPPEKAVAAPAAEKTRPKTDDEPRL